MICIQENGKECPFLGWNQKGNFTYHCNHNPERLVQICDEDLRAPYTCPIDLEKKQWQ